MTTPTVQIALHLNQDLLCRIEEFRYWGRLPSRTAAIRKLIETALDQKDREKSQ